MSVITVAAILNRWRRIFYLRSSNPIFYLAAKKKAPAAIAGILLEIAYQVLKTANALAGAGRRLLRTAGIARPTPGMPGAANR
jgi:hypothetical protein